MLKNKINYHKLFHIVLFAATVSITIDFFIAMVYTDGLIDINALHSQSGGKYGEGWIETIIFAILSLIGLIELINMKKVGSTQ